MPCPNCEHPTPDAWCPRCGQRQHPDGWGIGQIVSGWVRLWTLPLRPVVLLPGTLFPPGASASDIIEGRRARWPNPLAAYLGLLGLLTAMFSALSPTQPLHELLDPQIVGGLQGSLWIFEALRIAVSVIMRYAVVLAELPILVLLTRALLGPHDRGPSGSWVLTLHNLIAFLVATSVFLAPLYIGVWFFEAIITDEQTLAYVQGAAGLLVLLAMPMLLATVGVWCGIAAQRSFGVGVGRSLAYAVVFVAGVVVINAVALLFEFGLQVVVVAVTVLAS